ncbi:MAG: hypothetical protein MJA27_07105, partial [Pseudanabaenales cyanobacterium]|nr:hypothetical protein [Pseudanabaenales cyanobacterium]
YPAFKPTQMKSTRQGKPINNPVGPIPPLQINPAFKPIQIKSYWRNKPANDFPGSTLPPDKSS